MSKQKILYLSSEDEQSISDDYLSNIRWQLDTPIQNVKAVDLVSIGIPNTIYPVNEYNNKFIVRKEDRAVAGNQKEYAINIPSGFYTQAGLVALLDQAFTDTLDPEFENFEVTYDATLQFLTITSDQKGEDFELDFTGSHAYELLGIKKADLVNNIIEATESLTSTVKMRLGQYPYIFLSSNIPTNTMTTRKNKKSNILAKLDLKGKPNEMFVYNVANLGVSNFDVNVDYLDYLEFSFTNWRNEKILFYEKANVEITAKMVIWHD